MNIRLYTNKDYPAYSAATAISPMADRTKPAPEKAAGNYDTVTFQKTNAPADDASFARVLARVLARETASRIKQGASSEKVMNLQQQVASGSYHPDSAVIARRLLGYH